MSHDLAKSEKGVWLEKEDGNILFLLEGKLIIGHILRCNFSDRKIDWSTLILGIKG